MKKAFLIGWIIWSICVIVCAVAKVAGTSWAKYTFVITLFLTAVLMICQFVSNAKAEDA